MISSTRYKEYTAWEMNNMRALRDCRDMTVREFLDVLTNENHHTERMVIEAILTEYYSIKSRACVIWLAHMEYEYMPNELAIMRKELWNEIEGVLKDEKHD